MKTTKNLEKKETANVVIISKSEAKKAILAKLSNEVSLNKFCKLMQDLKNTDFETYKQLVLAYNLSETFEFTFEWFKENTPTDNNGKFAFWKKAKENSNIPEGAKIRKTDKGIIYYLSPYNVSKANYAVFLQMFSNTVAEIKRKQKEAEKQAKEQKKEESKKVKSDNLLKTLQNLSKEERELLLSKL